VKAVIELKNNGKVTKLALDLPVFISGHVDLMIETVTLKATASDEQ